jgi:hypothetical protein
MSAGQHLALHITAIGMAKNGNLYHQLLKKHLRLGLIVIIVISKRLNGVGYANSTTQY